MPKEIELTKGKFAIVDDEDYGYLNQFYWHSRKLKNIWYAHRNQVPGLDDKSYEAMHRVIMKAAKGQIVDHIDGNGLNNQKSNLRIVTNAQNCRNSKKHKKSSSKYKGVHWNKRASKWVPEIMCDREHIYLGYFKDEKEAAKAYNEAALKYFGEFACLNIIE